MKRTKNMNFNRFRKVIPQSKIKINYSTVLLVSTAFFLSACDDNTSTHDMQVYKNVQECQVKADTQAKKDQCSKDYSDALVQSKSGSAPQFSSQHDCENQFGSNSCYQSTPGYRTIWYPYMYGFTSGTSNYRSTPLYSGSNYSSSSYNKFVDAKGVSYTPMNGKISVPSSSMISKSASTGVWFKPASSNSISSSTSTTKSYSSSSFSGSRTSTISGSRGGFGGGHATSFGG